MLRRLSFAVVLLGVLGVATPSWANELSLAIRGGRVTLIAEGVTVRQILAEWARIGQTKVVNGERVSGPPVSLRLVDVPERQALETILRTVSGYLAAPRAALAANLSQYDRILILATSTAPAAASPGPAQRTGRMLQPFTPPPVQPDMEADDPGDLQEEADVQGGPGAPGFPQHQPELEGPATQQPMFPRRSDSAQPLYPGPVPEQQESQPAPQLVPGATTSSARPGQIVTPPQQPQAQPPTPGAFPVRPVQQPPQPQPQR